MTGRSPTPMTFENRVLFTVRNFVEYGTYGRDIRKASKTIHKHHPGATLNNCETAFLKYQEAYYGAIEFVEKSKDYYWSIRNNKSGFPAEKSPQEREFFSRHPDVPAHIIQAMIYFIFDWHHVR
jgi:hypothetical protein